MGRTLAISIMAAPIAASTAHAQVSDAVKLGANAAAMEFCRDTFMTDDDNGRYALLVATTTKEFGSQSDEKANALIMKKAAVDGKHSGDALVAGCCESIRKLLLKKNTNSTDERDESAT